jgi:hypothetical protein
MAQCLEREAMTQPVEAAVFVRRDQARMLEPTRARIVRLIFSEKKRIVNIVAGSKGRDEYLELRAKFFPVYLNLASMLSNSFSTAEPVLRDIAVREAFQQVTAQLEVEGKGKLAEGDLEEAKFCVDTLRRSFRLLGVIHKHGEVAPDAPEVDRSLALKFNATAVYSEFHLNCLLFGLQHCETMDAGILGAMLEGMRSSVMAYSYVRQGVALRQAPQQQASLRMSLDDEDRELLAESFAELSSDPRFDVEQ